MPSNQNSTYDIVLANGRVIDPETYLDAQMHVGITGDRIAAVSETPLEGKLVIDVSGHPCESISYANCANHTETTITHHSNSSSMSPLMVVKP